MRDPCCRRHSLDVSPLRVGIRAPDEMAGKMAYALEELLTAAGVPHAIELAPDDTRYDLFYGDRPPQNRALWMAASPQAWRFFEKPGLRVERTQALTVAGEPIRMPIWGVGDRVSDGGTDTRHLMPDLAAAAFFFLSRWEEWQAPERDAFGRFPLCASVFGRGLWSLTECPVEAYARALRRALEMAPRTPERPSFAIGLSHDIDTVRRWDGRGFARTARAAFRDLARGRVLAAGRAGRDLAAGLCTRASGRDPHQNLDDVVALERAAGARGTFFLLPRHTHRWDGTHPASYQRLLPSLARALAPVAEVGVHASTACWDDACRGSELTPDPRHPDPVAALRAERERLEELTGAPVRGVRFHNLRGGYEALPAVAAAGFEYDSTLGFAEEPGFLAGIARPFRPYDRERDCPLELVEVPLAVMDTTLLSPRYLGLDIAAGRRRALAALEAVRRSGGAAALLWHNDNLPPNQAGGYAALYQELIEWTRAAGGCVLPLGEIVDHWKQARWRMTRCADER